MSQFSELALSPDGTRLADVIERNGRPEIYLQVLDELEPKPIAGTEDPCCVFFSPDGRWLGFSEAGARLKRVAVSGGAPQTICDTPADYDASWGPDGTIVFAPSQREGLYRVDAMGGTPQVLTTPNRAKHEKSHRHPWFLPGGKAVLFTITTPEMSSYDEASIAVVSLEKGERRVLLDGGTNPRFIPTGDLLYVRGGSVVAVPFDPHRLEITAQAVPVVDGIGVNAERAADFSTAETGLVAYVRGNAPKRRDRLVWVDRRGKSTPLLDAHGPVGFFRLSPDGQRLALTIGGPNDHVWLYDLARGTLSRLTFDWNNQFPTWTPDGRRIVFRSDRKGTFNLYWQLWDGSSPAERLIASPNAQFGSSWSPDGNIFAFVDTRPTSHWDIWLLTLKPERQARPLMQTAFNEYSPVISPDGHWLAYVSDETGRAEVYVQSFPALGAKRQISTGGGTAPRWNPNGHELFYRSGGNVMTVTIAMQPAFAATGPRVLFDGPFQDVGYDMAADGRFIMIERVSREPSRTPIVLIQNWFEELRHRKPIS